MEGGEAPGSELGRLIARAEELRQEMDAALCQQGQLGPRMGAVAGKAGPEVAGSPGSRSGKLFVAATC